MIHRNPYALDPLEPRLLLATPGQLDTSFDGDGQRLYDFSGANPYNDFAHAVAVQPDGKILVAGQSKLAENGVPQTYHSMIRLHPSGAIDTSFGGGDGRIFLYGERGARIEALAVQDDGKIVAVGETESGDGIVGVIMRFLPSGAVDTGFFGIDGRYVATEADGYTRFVDVKIDSQGRIVVAGGNAGMFVARINPNGTFDSTFDGNGKKVLLMPNGTAPFPAGLDLAPDGDIVIGGRMNDQFNGPADVVLARINSNGSYDSNFAGGAGITRIDYSNGSNDTIYGLDVQPDGKIVAAGSVWNGGRQTALWRYNPDGTPDTTFGGGDGLYRGEAGDYDDVVVQPTGRIITLTNLTHSIQRHQANGFPDPGFTPVNLPGNGYELALHPGDKVMSVGETEATNQHWDYVIARAHAGAVDTTAVLDEYTTSGDDVVEVRRNGPNTEFYITSATIPTLIVPVAETAGLVLNMGGGNDVLRVFLEGGNPFTSSGITFEDGAGNDILAVYGSDSSDLLSTNAGRVGAGATSIYHTDPETIFLFGEVGNDLLAVNHAAATTTVHANGGPGGDTIGVGGGDIANLDGRVSVQGHGGDDRLLYNDSDQAAAHDYYLTTADITKKARGLTLGQPIEYQTIESIDLTAGTGANLIRIDSIGRFVPPSTLPLDVTLRGGAGNDDLQIGIGDLDAVTGALTLIGGPGTDSVLLDDDANSTAETYTFDSGFVQRSGSERIDFVDTESVSLLAGQAADTIRINGADDPVSVDAGAADDQILVGQGTLNNLLAAVTLTGGAGSDRVFIDDDSVAFAANYAITPATITRNIFTNLITYQAAETLELHTSNLADLINVQGTAANSRVVLRANIGDDTINVAETSPTGPVEIFPSVGNDTLNVNTDNTGSANVLLNFVSARFANLNLGAGGDLKLAQGAGASGGSLQAQNFTMHPAARLDLADNSIRVATTPATAANVLSLLTQRVASARNTNPALWTGPGITSSTARDHPTGLTGLAVAATPNEVLVTYALAADANLDKKVAFEDLVVLAQNYNAANKTFATGDFTYDAAVGFADLVLLAQRYGTTLPAASIPTVSAPAAEAPVSGSQSPSPSALFNTTPIRKRPAPQSRRQM